MRDFGCFVGLGSHRRSSVASAFPCAAFPAAAPPLFLPASFLTLLCPYVAASLAGIGATTLLVGLVARFVSYAGRFCSRNSSGCSFSSSLMLTTRSCIILVVVLPLSFYYCDYYECFTSLLLSRFLPKIIAGRFD